MDQLYATEVIFQDHNQTEGRFCSHFASTANLSSDAMGRTPALAVLSAATSAW